MSKFSVKKPYTVLVGVVLAIVLGVVAFGRMKADLLPNINLPYVMIMTTYVGASPETVETVVTSPIESGMATVSNIEQIRSVSSENYSMVILEFAQSANMDSVSLEIREKLDQIESYWDDSVSNPVVVKLNPDMLPVMIAAVGMEGKSQEEVSTYVTEQVIPALESIEGVASASGTGLLEESVNVIIRQEKVDALNEKIFASIDDKMAEAQKELEDGRKEIEDGLDELNKGQKELNKGKKEMADAKNQMQTGKDELEAKKAETAANLAQTKSQLLTAKSQLEASKATYTNNLNTAATLDATVREIQLLKDAATLYTTYYTQYAAAAMSQNAEEANTLAGNINALKKSINDSAMLKNMASMDASGQMTSLCETLNLLDWTSLDQTPIPPTEYTAMQTVAGSLTAISTAASNGLGDRQENAQNALNALYGETMSTNYTEYETTVKNILNTLETNLTQVNAGLVEVEKGELTAAVEFANASSQISLGEYQMEVSQSKLEETQKNIDSGKEQLEDAKAQLEDGEKQFEDAKQSAYEKADMTGILTVDMVKNLLTAQNFSMPAGYVTEEGISYLIRVGDKPETVEELQKLPLMDLHMDGVDVITLEDVADVFYTDNSDAIYTNVNGNAGVMISMQKQTGYSTGEVSDKLKDKFASMMEQQEGLSIITLMDQGIYIDLVMDSILNNILLGALLAILILLMFLKDIRPTAVVAFSIPVSLVAAVVCMYFSGVTLNVISLSGLALGIGMLVDNSIVVIENIYRMRNEGKSVLEASIEGAREVMGAIFASTLTTVCVFLPIVFTEGITRQLFVDLGLTIGYSLMASLLVALTVVPAMSSKMLVKIKPKKDGKIFGGLVKGYSAVLKGCLKVKPLVFVLALALLGGSIALALSNGTAFMTEMDSSQLTVSVKLGEEATLKETAAVTDQVVERIMSLEDVTDVGAMLNASTAAMLGGGSSDNTSTSIYVVTKEDKKQSNEELAAKIKEMTQDIEETEISVETSTMDMSALGGSGISIQVRGRDLDKIREIAGDVASIIEGVEGTTQVSDGLEKSDEEMRILVDRNKAAEYGLTVAQVFSQIMPKIASASSATTLVGQDKDYGVYVTNEADTKLTREDLKKLMVEGQDAEGQSIEVPLKDVARFETAYSLSSINRQSQTRYVAVTAAIADGYNVGLVSNEVNKKLENYAVPDGYSLVFQGENETINEAIEQVLLMLVLAVVLMYLIMVAQFQSLLLPFIIMFTIPLAFTGGFLGLYISGFEVSVIALVGFVMLAGIIVNNGIVLIDYINQLRQSGMEKKEAILTAGKTRLRPVLMTALTTILALSTMVFSQEMGADMARPMAIVTIGGLLYGTLLTLVVIPCLYDVFTRNKKKIEVDKQEAI